MPEPTPNHPGFFSNPLGDLLGGLTAAIFGGTPGQVSGPTGPMTVVVVGLMATTGKQANLVFAAVLIGGAVQILFGLFRLGKLVHYIPYPVISGFMTGIGTIIIVLQVPVLFGLDGGGRGVIEMLGLYERIPANWNPAAAALGVGALATILLVKRYTPRVPGALVALLLTTIIAVAADLNVPKIGDIPDDLPTPRFPAFGLAELSIIAQAALALAILGSLDSLLTSVVVDRITGRRHNSNKELVGQGIGNIASGLVGGLPGAGATMRSVVNINTGGRSNLSGTFHALVLIAILLGLGKYTSHIPHACLAGILIHVGITILDYRGLRSMRTAPRADTAVMVVVLGLTVFFNLIVAVVVGIALAIVFFIKKLNDVQPGGFLRRFWVTDSEHGPFPVEELPEDCPESTKGSIYVYTFRGALNFVEAKFFSEVMFHLTGIRHVILVFEAVPVIDQTGAYTVEDTIEQLQRKGINVILVHPAPEVRTALEKMATRPRPGGHVSVDTVEAAIELVCSSTGEPAGSSEN